MSHGCMRVCVCVFVRHRERHEALEKQRRELEAVFGKERETLQAAADTERRGRLEAEKEGATQASDLAECRRESGRLKSDIVSKEKGLAAAKAELVSAPCDICMCICVCVRVQ